MAVVQPVTNNNRQRIAPVNSALINSMRLRDPRLMRQPPQSGQIMQPPQHLAGQKLESNGPRKLYKMITDFPRSMRRSNNKIFRIFSFMI